jgi:hypothetical protein
LRDCNSAQAFDAACRLIDAGGGADSELVSCCRASLRQQKARVQKMTHSKLMATLAFTAALGANNLQQSWRFDREPPKAVLRDVWTIDWILGG